MRIGLVDLDTSHPEAFIPLIRAHGHDVVAVHNSGAVLDASETQEFALRHGISLITPTLDHLIEEVDVAFVHTVNWDLHASRIEPIVAAGRGVVVCKPIAGNVADLTYLENLSVQGARIFGGSSLRWCAAAAPIAGAHAGWITTFGHPFDYGIHAFAFAQGLFGRRIERVRALDLHSRANEVQWSDGGSTFVSVLDESQGYGFHAAIAGQDGVHYRDATGSDLYGPFVTTALDHLAGTQAVPSNFRSLVEPERAAIAARASAAHGGIWVDTRDDQLLASGSWPADKFADSYARKRQAQRRG